MILWGRSQLEENVLGCRKKNGCRKKTELREPREADAGGVGVRGYHHARGTGVLEARFPPVPGRRIVVVDGAQHSHDALREPEMRHLVQYNQIGLVSSPTSHPIRHQIFLESVGG